MKTYLFGSVRGDDFEIEGESPEEAYQALCEREKDNGVLWRLHDDVYNLTAIRFRGYSSLDECGSVVYKEKDA